MKLIINVDGGSRGNPGPAAAAAVVSTPAGEIVDESAEVIGVATNNVAEYKALLLGIKRARELEATEIEIICDSELVAHQVNGSYRVRHAAMKPLFLKAMRELRAFDSWTIRAVPRLQNAEADRLVNEALDGLVRNGSDSEREVV